MWIVTDWHKTKFFGPFNSKNDAEEWLAKQGVMLGQYESQEVSVNELRPTTEILELF